jgi:hypothetical protein
MGEPLLPAGAPFLLVSAGKEIKAMAARAMAGFNGRIFMEIRYEVLLSWMQLMDGDFGPYTYTPRKG